MVSEDLVLGTVSLYHVFNLLQYAQKMSDLWSETNTRSFTVFFFLIKSEASPGLIQEAHDLAVFGQIMSLPIVP